MALTGSEGAFYVLEYARTQSVVLVQRSFRTKFGKNTPVRNSVKQWYKKFWSDGSCLCIAKRPGRPGPSEESDAFEGGRPFIAAP